uniref:Uncharacterized protein n=1 Tax=Panagrellus redivivus TaxID=6233 RepID=A0A7E4VQ42_PANRE
MSKDGVALEDEALAPLSSRMMGTGGDSKEMSKTWKCKMRSMVDNSETLDNRVNHKVKGIWPTAMEPRKEGPLLSFDLVSVTNGDLSLHPVESRCNCQCMKPQNGAVRVRA